MEIKNRHVLVTGGAQRLGRAICESLLESSVHLTVHYHQSQTEAQAFVAKQTGQGRKVQSVQADLRDPASIQSAVNGAVKTYGPVDLLVNCASVFYRTPADECTPAQWDENLEVNLKGQFFFAQSVWREMHPRGGLIVNLTDTSASHPVPRLTPYVCAKAGLRMMTKSLAKEWAPKIRVNCISPGAVLLPENYTPEQKAAAEARSLMKRVGTPADIVSALWFFIRNDYVTGFDLVVDGGRSLT